MLHRFFIFDEFNNNKFSPNSKLKKQITKVLRINEKEKFLVISNGNEYLANYKNNFIFIEKKLRSYKKNNINIILIQAIPKNSKQKYILQKSTELGVDEIIFFQSKRSISKLEQIENKKERFFNILKESSEQSNRLKIPELKYVNNIFEYIENINGLKIFAYEEKGEKFNISQKELNKHKNIYIVIGPEGGFEKEEVSKFQSYGFEIINFGENILRTETASIYVLSVIKYILSI